MLAKHLTGASLHVNQEFLFATATCVNEWRYDQTEVMRKSIATTSPRYVVTKCLYLFKKCKAERCFIYSDQGRSDVGFRSINMGTPKSKVEANRDMYGKCLSTSCHHIKTLNFLVFQNKETHFFGLRST